MLEGCFIQTLVHKCDLSLTFRTETQNDVCWKEFTEVIWFNLQPKAGPNSVQVAQGLIHSRSEKKSKDLEMNYAPESEDG